MLSGQQWLTVPFGPTYNQECKGFGNMFQWEAEQSWNDSDKNSYPCTVNQVFYNLATKLCFLTYSKEINIWNRNKQVYMLIWQDENEISITQQQQNVQTCSTVARSAFPVFLVFPIAEPLTLSLIAVVTEFDIPTSILPSHS